MSIERFLADYRSQCAQLQIPLSDAVQACAHAAVRNAQGGGNGYILLRLASARLSPADVAATLGAASRCPLVREIGLSYTPLGRVGCQHLSLLLANDHPLERLAIDACQLTDDDIEPLLASLRSNINLQHLSVAGNRLGPTAAESLAQVLRGGRTALVSLNLSGNPLRDAGGVEILSSLKGNTRLTTLQLDRICAGSRTAHAVLKTLDTNRSLSTISLRFNSCPDHLLSTIASRLLLRGAPTAVPPLKTRPEYRSPTISAPAQVTMTMEEAVQAVAGGVDITLADTLAFALSEEQRIAAALGLASPRECPAAAASLAVINDGEGDLMDQTRELRLHLSAVLAPVVRGARIATPGDVTLAVTALASVIDTAQNLVNQAVYARCEAEDNLAAAMQRAAVADATAAAAAGRAEAAAATADDLADEVCALREALGDAQSENARLVQVIQRMERYLHFQAAASPAAAPVIAMNDEVSDVQTEGYDYEGEDYEDQSSDDGVNEVNDEMLSVAESAEDVEVVRISGKQVLATKSPAIHVIPRTVSAPVFDEFEPVADSASESDDDEQYIMPNNTNQTFEMAQSSTNSSSDEEVHTFSYVPIDAVVAASVAGDVPIFVSEHSEPAAEQQQQLEQDEVVFDQVNSTVHELSADEVVVDEVIEVVDAAPSAVVPVLSLNLPTETVTSPIPSRSSSRGRLTPRGRRLPSASGQAPLTGVFAMDGRLEPGMTPPTRPQAPTPPPRRRRKN